MRPAIQFRVSAAALLLVACATPEPASDGDLTALEITYVANEGFLLAAGEDKILIDGLFREGVAGYAVLAEEWRDPVETGQPPFDAVDLALATHYHADHFDARAVCHFLESNPLAEFVSTEQAVDRMRAGCDDPSALIGRVRVGLSENRDSIPFRFDSLRVEPIFMHHGAENPVDNIGFVIEIGGWTVLHMGDTEIGIEEMEATGLGERGIDLAFIPYWYLLDRDWSAVVTDVLRPNGIVAMHLPPPGSPHLNQDWDALVARIERSFPGAMVFAESFDSRTFRERR